MKEILNNKYFKFTVIISIVLLFAFISVTIYVNDYYHADTESIAAFKSDGTVLKEINDDNTIVYHKDSSTIGFIFYPGGKVEYIAYEPLMIELASRGILCVLVKMPFNLAVLDINAADGVQSKFQNIKNWYIGGHSLGGAMAATYLSRDNNTFDGLILLGSYSTSDLSHSDLNVISIYGNQDKILNQKEYKSNIKNLPSNYFEYIIDGGCHSYFGVYGMQDGDGIPTISNKEQILITSDLILNFINSN